MQFAPASAAWIAVPAGIGLIAVWRLTASASVKRRARHQLFGGDPVESRPAAARASTELWASWLERWLFISGFRDSGAVARFLMVQAGALALGVALSLAVSRSGLTDIGVEWLLEIPGGLGHLFAPVLALSPWILLLVIGLLPVARVRSRRREIVQMTDQDLPMTLALLATLVESGLGFDAALKRILASMDPDRALARELALFRSETQAGVPRLACFRALAQRLDVVSMYTFVSAMIHAEHVGGGIAESLRRQADEVWNRRRELAIQRAQTLPTKLAIPLVICFLPGIFVYTLGPALAEFARIAESVISGSSTTP